MIQFRSEQMPQFETGVVDAFVAEQVRRLRNDFAKELVKNGVSERELETLVRGGMASAEKYEFDTRDLIVFYLDCTAILGPKFDDNPRHPWAGEILRRRDLIPESKADLLDQHLIFQPGL